MVLKGFQKDRIKQEIGSRLSSEKEIEKIIIFGSFINSENPQDVDVAIFQDSDQQYLPLSLKYRRLTREIAKQIPLDIFPLRAGADNLFMDEIQTGEVIYER